MRGQKDLRLLAALSVLCAAAALLIPLGGVALIFAVPLALLLPGYAISAAAFARRPLGWPQFLLLSIALSLATLVLGGLVLNYAGGIHPLSWALLLVLVVLGCGRAAALRRGDSRQRRRGPRPRLRAHEVAMLIGAVAVTVAAFLLAFTNVPNDDALGYTQLWVLPKPGSGGREAQVGVRSQQQAPASFDLRVKVGDKGLVKRSFQLSPGETRLVSVQPPPGSEGTVPVIATLLLHNRPFSVYRRVKGSLTAPEAPR